MKLLKSLYQAAKPFVKKAWPYVASFVAITVLKIVQELNVLLDCKMERSFYCTPDIDISEDDCF